MSGIMCDQEFIFRLHCIKVQNEWGTNVELAILRALAQIDALLINITHVDSHFWRVETVFMHDKLMIHTQCNPLYQWGQTFLIHGPISDFSQGKLIYNFTFNNFYSCITISTIVNYFCLVQSGLV